MLKQVEVKALNNVSIELREREILGIVGASGSGKSTLAKLLVFLYRADSGSIFYMREDVTKHRGRRVKEYRRSVQMVFQDPYASLDPNHTVDWHIRRPLKLLGNKQNINSRIDDLLETVKLTPTSYYLEKYPHQLSGGQRQRVYLARVLALNPRVIIADEPVSMLDVSVRIEVLELIKNLRDKFNISVIYITHDLNTVSLVTERIYVMDKGSVVESGSTNDIITNPKEDYTRRLIQAAPDPYNRI
jgi:peptide/nickel transport system ATP-binding protein